MSWMYNFPEHRDAGKDEAAQVDKVYEEAVELMTAFDDGEPEGRIREECLDVMHACETLLRSWPAGEVARSRDAVVVKNEARGYYRGEDE